MNRVFRVVWSTAMGAWVVASELAGRHGKGRGRAATAEAGSRATPPGIPSRGWPLRLGIVAGLMSLYLPAYAVDRYWDVNLGSANNGGTGTWNTTTAYWNASSDGVAGPFFTWDNVAIDNAVFAGTAGTVTLDGAMTANTLTFSTAGYTLTGGTLMLAGATPTIAVNTGTTTIGSVVAGTAGLTKSGAGILSLTGANTFSGDVTVSGGRLTLADDASLGDASNTVTLADGTSLGSTGALAASRSVTVESGRALIFGGALSAHITGAGGVQVSGTISNDTNDYTGQTIFGQSTHGFTSVADLGVASSLGAPTDPALGTIRSSAGGGLGNTLVYSGDGDQSNRDWIFTNTSSGGNQLQNAGTGTLTLTGNIAGNGGYWKALQFSALKADMDLLGVISAATGRPVNYTGGAGQTITLGDANTYDGNTNISNITVKAGTLADSGSDSSLGSGSLVTLSNGVLSYTGAGASSDRTLSIAGASSLRNDGTGALSLNGATTLGVNSTLKLDGSASAANTLSGIISGTGNLVVDGAGGWALGGANTYAGTTTVQSGTLIAGSTDAFGLSKGLIVNGGMLDLNGLSMTAPSLAGTGGIVDVDGGSLTLKSSSGNTTYGGSIAGAGSLTKLGASTQTLTGSNTYTGATAIGGGTLALDFTGAGAPASNIIDAASALAMGGGTLAVKGTNGASSQDFDGLTVTAGNNRISATAGSGGTLTLGLGGISRSGGLIDFGYNTGATITTSHADGALGGWATVNGTDYAQVTGGVITAFTDYQNKDDASLWLNGDIVSDAGGNADTPYFSTVNGNVALGGLKYTAAADSTVNVGAGNLLGIDGTIIVTSTVGTRTQQIQGGSVSGGPGGGALGVQQNSAGTFVIGSNIEDNGVPTSFTVGGSGTGEVRLTGSNTYTGATTISGSTLEIKDFANGGMASSIGASSADASNLVLENGTLLYSGGVGTTDRGFTLVNGGPSRTIQVYGDAGDLTFGGQVTSPDDAGFTKTGGGVLRFTNTGNDFTGPVTVSAGTLSVATIGNGGQASSLGAGSTDPASLLLQTGGSLQFTGATTTTDRGFTLTGGAGHVDVTQAATDLTVDGTVVGGGNLVKDGAGTLILGGTNTYTGGNTVTAGILRAASDQAFGGQANGTGAGQLTVASGATADLDGHKIWVAGVNGAGDVTLGTGTLQIRAGGTFSGTISGAGSVASASGGRQVFSGCGNTYTGATTIVSSTLTTDCLANGGQASGIGASTSDPANLTLSSGWLTYTGADVATDRGVQLAGNGGIAVNEADATLTLGGLIQGGGQLIKGGDGTLLVTGSSTYTGSTRVEEGTLRAGNDNAFGSDATYGGGNMVIDNYAGATLDLDGHDVRVRALYGGGTTGGTVALGGGSLTLTTNGSGTAEFAGVVTGAGTLVKNGSYRQWLSGCDSSYSGSTTVGVGTLAVNCLDDGGAASSIGMADAGAGNLVLDGGTLQYVGAGSSTDRLFTLGPSTTSALDASGTGAVQFTNTGAIAFSGTDTAQTVTLTGTSSADNSLAAQITDNGAGQTSVSKTGTGTWILRNAGSTYGGVTRILGGVLGVDHLTDGGQGSSIGASSNAAGNLVIGNGATLRYTGAGDTTDRLFTLSVGTSVIESSGTGAIVFANTGSAAYAGNGNRTLGLGGENTGLNTMGGTIVDGPGGVTTLAKNGGGTWLLTGNNTFTGNTVINGGLLQIGDGGTTGTIGSPSITVAAGTLGFDRSDTLTIDGTISGAGDVRQSGTGTTVLTATNTYTGGTSISNGTLQLGNGGASGSILGDVVDDGLLAFDRSDAYTFGGTVSGSGGVSQLGAGTTVLTAANSYKGTTAVRAGTLLVNGDQSAATGGTTVYTGATLGGDGTIGGTVLVQSGGTLNPGAASGAAGTLTINGALSLASGSAMNFQFGQANVVGGPLNDLVVVHGNLGLNGTLNVSATPGGSFGPGLYRIISYDGTLTDNGLDLGTTPAGTYQVQTSVAHQVNLLNSNGLSLNFWDGPAGHGNDTVDGGTGVWQNASGNDNWTDQTGQFNAPYADGQFAIFMGAPGTVTVDGGLGAVTSSGMQFAVDGYTVGGDAITLTGASNIVRVGDGTAAGAGMTAAIDAALSGTGGLVKEDLGTLILNGINNYTGGTAINGGVLEASSNTALGNTAGGISFDGGTLRTTGVTNFATARSITINQGGATIETLRDMLASGAISGAGGLTKTGTGRLYLSGANTYAGGTAINGGSISVGSDGNLGNASGALSLDGGTLRNSGAFASARSVTLGSGGGTFDTVADLTLTGTVAGPGALNKIDSGALVLAGDNTYAGGTTVDGGVLQLGNGGSAGSIIGDVVNNGTLVFDRSDTFAFAGLVSGSGALEQHGGGTTVLGGDNTYTGPTAVRAGSLIVNGDQSGATGATSVDAGGSLGGGGIIGGDVSLADGATLVPGGVGSAPGTLTIRGSLALSDASNLDVDFGQANVVGGPFNDLVQVDGDLTLDGTLDVSVSSGGSFDPGIYRIIGYGGALIDSGMDIGSVPSADYFLQTSVAHQVNLVNTAGLSVNFWDGNGGRGDDQVEGGNGVWQDGSGNDNWTLTDGSLNAPYQDGAFAIFTGTGGTVTVDGSLGAVNSGGMQFAVGGYRVEGDSITLGATPTVIRVGDGTTAGTGMIATIASVLTGSGGLTKSDLGELVLAGDNTYTGDTTITDGVLQLGEGGASGSIQGDVVDDGILAFDRSDVHTFGGTVSGTGVLMQVGSGTVRLTAANTYTGETIMQSGTLLVNGDQSAATGATTVRSSGTLGGTGTIGGDVRVGDGGTLSPGEVGAAGTLTINGDLTLAGTSTLDYQLGQAGTPGGALNDLTVVHGDLTLDGTLDVAATPGGTFGAGVYRLISYDGALTDHGLAVGTSPLPDVFVQTSIDHQVNLVNTTGLTLSFWDGPGHANDGAIAGGTGTWRLADNDYWSDASGALNASYSDGALAVFGGTGGTVAVDDSNGQVTASGLQFASDGYRITGDSLMLAGGAVSVRVGDGSSAGKAMTATIDAAIMGPGMLVKDDLGTLVLDGANAYAGGTEIRAGTLQIANDGNLGLGVGALAIGDGTLHTTGDILTSRTVGLGGNASFEVDGATTLELAGSIAGSGSLTKTGGGTLILHGASSYAGATTVAQGVLGAAVEDAFNASSAFTVQSAGTLDLAGHAQHLASLANAGTVRFGDAPGTTLTVRGNYTGQGGILAFNAALGGDASATDRLVVDGDTAGNTTVRVANVGGAGAQTTDGIKLIDVQGKSGGTFALQGDYVFQGEQAVVAGAYAYRLYRGTDSGDDGDWYLRSALTSAAPGGDGGDPPPLYQPGVPLYEAYAGALLAANQLDTLQQRTGSRNWAAPQADDNGRGEGLWMRVVGDDSTFRPEISTSGTAYDVSTWKLQAGVDATLADASNGALVGGVALRAGRFQTGVRSIFGSGRLRTDAYGIGGTLTWYGDRGFYVDGQVHWSRYDTELRSGTLGRVLADGNDADGYALGVELGQRIRLDADWSLVPQAQVSWGRAAFDEFQDSYGTPVAFRSGTDVTGRAGLAADYRTTRQGARGAVTTHVYVIGNIYRQFEGDTRVDVAGTGLVEQNDRQWGGLGLGGALDWAGGRYSLYGEVQAKASLSRFRESHSVGGTVGFRMKW